MNAWASVMEADRANQLHLSDNGTENFEDLNTVVCESQHIVTPGHVPLLWLSLIEPRLAGSSGNYLLEIWI